MTKGPFTLAQRLLLAPQSRVMTANVPAKNFLALGIAYGAAANLCLLAGADYRWALLFMTKAIAAGLASHTFGKNSPGPTL